MPYVPGPVLCAPSCDVTTPGTTVLTFQPPHYTTLNSTFLPINSS